MPSRYLIVLAILVVLHFAPGFSAAESKRFIALLQDGRIVEDDMLRNWYSGNAMPQLAGQSLIVGDNPMRWMMDRSLAPAEVPTAYIEFFSGDRLPGQMVFHQAAGTELQVDVPEHFAVVPSFPFARSVNSRYRENIRVRRDFVRKIVWQKAPALVDRHVPSTLFLTNGREIAFRAIRFSKSGVQVLADRERLSFSFHEVAELHLEEEALWRTHLRELAILFPGGGVEPADRQRLVQWETTDGLVATTSVQRIDADSRGDNNNSDRWVHGIQPAWSLDILWIASSSTWMRRSWAFHELPLFRLPFQESRGGAMFSRHGFPARVNRGVLGGTAQLGDRIAGWNLGVMGPSRLTFPLPPWTTAFHSSFGIDQAADDGGCVQAKVGVSWKKSSHFQSEAIVGSEKRIDVPELKLEDIPADGQLVLEVDFAHEGRPDGADPYDIRDMSNWIEPRLVLDKEKIRQEVRRQTIETILAWGPWELESDLPKLHFVTTKRRIEWPHESPSWRTGVVSQDEPLRLTLQKQITPENCVLEVATAKLDGPGDTPEIQVTVQGIPLLSEAQRNVNIHDHLNTPPPMIVDLGPFVGSEATIEITQTPSSIDGPVDWRTLQFRDTPSFLRPILEDPTQEDVKAMRTLEGEPAPVMLRSDIRLINRPALEIQDGPWVRIASFDPPLEIRERPLPGQFRQFRFAYAKKGGGHLRIRLLYEEDAERPAIYSIGLKNVEKDSGIVKLNDGKIDDKKLKWEVQNSLDVHQHFGPINVTGIAVQSVGGESCLWDHFYLGGASLHMERIAINSVEQTNWDDWEKRREELLPRLSKAMVQVTIANEPPRPGILVHPSEGIIAVWAPDPWKPGEKVSVTRGDGESFEAKTMGAVNESSMGLVKLDSFESSEAWSHFDLTHKTELEDRQVCLIIQPGTGPDWIEADLSRSLTRDKQMILLTRPVDFACRVGAICLNRDHQVCGIVTELAPRGEPVMTNANPLRENWENLKSF